MRQANSHMVAAQVNGGVGQPRGIERCIRWHCSSSWHPPIGPQHQDSLTQSDASISQSAKVETKGFVLFVKDVSPVNESRIMSDEHGQNISPIRMNLLVLGIDRDSLIGRQEFVEVSQSMYFRKCY
jgi:hypothetical protein